MEQISSNILRKSFIVDKLLEYPLAKGPSSSLLVERPYPPYNKLLVGCLIALHGG